MSRFESWSRRKRGLEENSAGIIEDKPPEPTEAIIESGQKPTIIEAESVLEEGSLDAQLPDPDTLEPDSDFKSFLQSGVSPELKRRALRRMFTAEHFNVRDGLDDYDQDFSKMRKLSSETTAQLRRWMNKLTESESATEQDPPTQTAHENQHQHTELASENKDDIRSASTMKSEPPASDSA